METRPIALDSNGHPASSWSSIVQAAVAYGARGWSVIPLRGTQPSLADWRPYQTQRANEQCLRWWFAHPWDAAGVGIICGPVSHGLAVLEIADPPLAERLVQEGVGHLTRLVRTPSQGLQLYVYGTQTPTATAPLIPAVATLKGGGGYVVAPPSLGYTVMTDGPVLEVPDVKAWALALLARCGVVGGENTPQPVPADQTVNTRPLHSETQQPQPTPAARPTTNAPPVPPPHKQEDPDFCPISLGQMEEPGPRTELVERLIPEGYATVLFGDGGMGKSYLALGLAMCVATGQPFVGLTVRSCGVLYLDWELNADEFHRRGISVARGLGLSCPPANLYYAQVAQPFSSVVGRVKTFIDQQHIGLVIIDSVGMACAGDPELARDVLGFFALLKNLNVTVLAVDHQSKLQEGQHYAQKTPFGSAYKSHLARSIIQVERSSGHEGWLTLRLRHKKLTFGPMSQELGVTLQFEKIADAETVRLSAWNPTTAPVASQRLSDQEKIEHRLQQDGPATSDVLAQRTGVHSKTVRNHVARLHKAGKIKEAGSNGHAVIWAWIEVSEAAPSANNGTPVEGAAS